MSKGRAARLKGHNFEREIANLIKEIDPTARRNVSESQSGSFDILTALPFAIQCKCFSRWHVTPHSVLDQAIEHAKEKIPVGIVRISNKRPDLAIIRLQDFVGILREFYAEKKDTNSDSSP